MQCHESILFNSIILILPAGNSPKFAAVGFKLPFNVGTSQPAAIAIATGIIDGLAIQTSCQ